MFISALDLFKIGIGPSSSHTLGPMVAARDFVKCIGLLESVPSDAVLHCTLKGSLAFTGEGHATDLAVTLGIHGYTPESLAGKNVTELYAVLQKQNNISIKGVDVFFNPKEHIVFDKGESLPQHPNGLIFELITTTGETVLGETYFSIGGGFVQTMSELENSVPINNHTKYPYAFDSADSMLDMTEQSGQSIAQLKRTNEYIHLTDAELDAGLDHIWQTMKTCVKQGITTSGKLPGGLNINRRANVLFNQLTARTENATMHEWLMTYAMAVNEENAAGHTVVTGPTNGAAGVIAAVLYYFVHHENGTLDQVREFLLTASAIGGIIKHRSSISGAEVGCQGEIGSAAAMAAAGLCAVKGGTPLQIENAAEIALEHHLGMTCDPVKGLVQVPCIERNGFGAIKAYAAASLSMLESGQHFMSFDKCIAAMKQIGLDMSNKYKETSLGGLAVCYIEC